MAEKNPYSAMSGTLLGQNGHHKVVSGGFLLTSAQAELSVPTPLQ